LIENKQEPFGGNVPPERLTKNTPEILPVCTVPPQNDPMTPRGAVDNPVGKLSPNAIFVSDTVELGLVILNVRLVVPPTGMLAAPKFLAIVGGATTVMLAWEVFPVPPSLEDTVTLLFNTPAVVPCTLTETVQDALEANVPPDRLTVPEPAVAVAVPPHVLLRFGVEATTRPAGRLSVKASPVKGTLVFGLVMLKVSVLVPLV
jgi:hypothetical protein